MTTKTKPAVKLSAITPSNATVFYPAFRSIYVGAEGNVAILAELDSASVTLVGVPAGTILPISVKQVLATGTTATDIVGML